MKSQPGISAVASKMMESHEMVQFSAGMLEFSCLLLIFYVLFAFQKMVEGWKIEFCRIFGKSNQFSKNTSAGVNLDVHARK